MCAEREESSNPVLDQIRSRRVTRSFTGESLDDRDIEAVLEAARWAPNAGNRRIHRYLIVRSPERVNLVRSVSPGMLARPAALIVICTDLERARVEQVQVERDTTVWIDVGTAAMSMMMAAHALGLGSCPTTSFSRGGVREVLELPSHAIPEFVLQLGRPAPEARKMRAGASMKLTLKDLCYWERYGSS
jgi:nitroreductase